MPAIGQFLHADTSTPYYTPWAGRGGNSAVMVLEVIAAALTGGGSMSVTVQTKNSENDDSAPDSLGSFTSITASSATPFTFFAQGFKELYRLKVSFVSTGANDWVHFRDLDPSWLWN